ncbi:MAG: hypothetical protein WBA57_23685 [Elainellaceae cyanobacterium]
MKVQLSYSISNEEDISLGSFTADLNLPLEECVVDLVRSIEDEMDLENITKIDITIKKV